MKILIVGNSLNSLRNFRLDLLRRFVSRDHEVVAASPDSDARIENEIRAAGIRYESLPFQRTGMNPLSDLVFFLRCLKLVAFESPDLLINYTGKPMIFSTLAGRLMGVPKIVCLVTGLGFAFTEGGQGRLRRALKALMVGLLRGSSGKKTQFVFQNTDDLEQFRSLGIVKPETRTLVMRGSGVNLETFKKSDLKKAKTLKFLLVARLLADKGVREYAEAAKKLVSQYKDRVEFHVLGPLDSNPSAISREELNDWVNAGILHYDGETSDVRPYLADCHVFVLPSYREGTPKSALEAMATGRAIVSTNVPGCREVVREGVNGFLVPPRDATALARALEQFVSEEDLASKMGNASRAFAEEVFDSKLVNQVFYDTFV